MKNEVGRITSTVEERTEAFEWLRSTALVGQNDWRKAAIMLQEVVEMKELVEQHRCDRYFGIIALDCAQRLLREGIHYPICKWCSQVSGV